MNNDFFIKQAKEKIIEVGKLLYDKGYNVGKDGNISMRIDSEHILITQSGALLGFLSEDDLVIVDKEGKTSGDEKKNTIF